MPAMGTAAPKTSRIGRPDDARRGAQPGQDLDGDAEEVEQLVRPFEAVQIEQHGARGVAVVGHVVAAAGEPPDEEAVDRCRPAAGPCGELGGARPVGEQPLDLGGAEVGVETQAGAGLDRRPESRPPPAARSAPPSAGTATRWRSPAGRPSPRPTGAPSPAGWRCRWRPGRRPPDRRSRAPARQERSWVAQISSGSCSTHPGCG